MQAGMEETMSSKCNRLNRKVLYCLLLLAVHLAIVLFTGGLIEKTDTDISRGLSLLIPATSLLLWISMALTVILGKKVGIVIMKKLLFPYLLVWITVGIAVSCIVFLARKGDGIPFVLPIYMIDGFLCIHSSVLLLEPTNGTESVKI